MNLILGNFFSILRSSHTRYLVTLTLWFFSGSGLCEEKIFNSCEKTLFSF